METDMADQNQDNNQGKGWYGDPEGHSKAGRGEEVRDEE